jgi:RND family efflux transporter MFP subunit
MPHRAKASLVLSLAMVAAFAATSLASVHAAEPAPPLFQDYTNRAPVVLKAKREATLSARVDGQIESIPVVFGQQFNEGDLLVKIRDTIYSAALARAGAILQAAARNFDMVSEMRGRADASEIDLENAKRDAAVASSAYRLAEEDLSSCVIAAPFPGRVLQVVVNEQESIQRQQPLMQIVDDRTLMAHFLMPQTLYSQLKQGMELQIDIPILNTTVPAKVERISAAFDSNSKTIEVYAEIDNSGDQFRVGMNGWLNLEQIQIPPKDAPK